MLCCVNPDCQKPLNPDKNNYCHSCRAELIPLLGGRYRPTQVLSDEGGFGRTYLAEDVHKLNECCVVKQFAPKLQGTGPLTKAIELFKQEASRLQELAEHPQIPTLLAYFEQNGYLFLVQQFIDGQNLLKEWERRGNYSETQIRELLLDLLPVLKFIHLRGVIHRDIKPQNIIRRQSDGRLVLIDFGASKQLTATVQTKMGTVIGSHGYTALEQMQDGKAYPASDLFSLGATCFHLLTGVRPSQLWIQQGYSWVGSWRQYVISPGRDGVSVSIELGEVLDKLLQLDIQKRYQSADEVIADLTPGLSSFSSLPVTLLTPTFASTPANKRPVSPKLNKTLKSQLLLISSILVLGLGGVWYFQTRPHTMSEYSPSNSPPSSLPISAPSKSDFLPKAFKGHSSDVNSVAFSPDGITLGSASDDKTIKLWNLTSGEEIQTLEGHSNWIWTVAFSPDSKTLASGSADKTIKLWNVETGKLVRTLEGNTDGVTSVAFSPDGKTLASGTASKDIKIKLWNLETGKLIRTLEGHTDGVPSVAFSPDGKTLASGSWDKTIKLWNLNTGKEIRTLKGNAESILSVAFAPDGVTLASGSKDKTIKLWNLNTGKEIRTLKGHKDKVNSVAFLPSGTKNGLTLVSGSSDKTIKLWNPLTGKEIRTLDTGSGYIYAIAISPDGETIAGGGSGENLLKIWQPIH
ncbi:serine/threonine protein kinase [Nostoc sp. UCD121]|uniref:serine/threonine-protein kinase n=1 Tax=unclassified Nostoc TaxID=2593658 RepID=UPI0016284627|nr:MULTISPECIES: serine/threonine-protein kinase [unclassified Nostoc]MBC1220030.1 serine/threonine protein kinase [Nostoc sp. UCD120]MBC1274592.1 serine/threonine protein kinase [Nostoc sp. UCD121]MBC1297205.1 serine/threonine protein kinase [Nostoc sp. UCD122]